MNGHTIRPAVLASILTTAWALVSSGATTETAAALRARDLWAETKCPDAYTLAVGERGPRATIPLSPNWRAVELSCEAACSNLTLGAQFYSNGRIIQQFVDARGKRVGKWPATLGLDGTRDWAPFRARYEIPAGAVRYELHTSNMGATGVFSISNLRVRVALTDEDLKPHDEPLPAGYDDGDPWDLTSAWRDATDVRMRLCLNGLWQCRVACSNEAPAAVPQPGDYWGWAKVPGLWRPDRARAVRTNGVYLPEGFFLTRKDTVPEVRWFRRTLRVPAEAAGRRALLTFTGVHSKAEVFVDGKSAGTVLFPEGEADLTDALVPGNTHELAVRVSAWPCDWTRGTFDGPATPALLAVTDHAVRKTVEFAGLTGDVYLDLVPKADRITGACARADVARRTITFVAETAGLASGRYRLTAETTAADGTTRTFTGDADADAAGTLHLTASWPEVKIWTLDTPSHLYDCRLTLADTSGRTLDTAPRFRFGFRDVRVAGRDLLLNGAPVHLRGLTNNSTCDEAGKCSKPAVTELCRRLKSDGVNFLIAANYAVQPGQFTYLDALLDACDEAGILYVVTLPHAREFGWFAKPDAQTRYAALARTMIAHVRNHPCVFAYAMTHNRVGYPGDIDPERLRGDFAFPTNDACRSILNRQRVARTAEQIAKTLDPTRLVYHHEGGTLGDIQMCNNYLNWAPIQERSEWISDWASHGVKPLGFIEWGMPHIASWSSYRGPLFIWTRPAYQSLWASEFAAALRGDAAFDASPAAYACLDAEERQWQKRRPFRYSELLAPLRAWQDNYQAVQATHLARNLPDFRAWGLTAFLPWDQGNFYSRVVQRRTPRPNPDAFKNLRRPGIVSDDYPSSHAYWTDMGEPADFALTEVGAVWRNSSRAQLAFLGGDTRFTDRRHNYRPGEIVSKQLVLVNDAAREARVTWSCALENEAGCVVARQNGTVSAPSGKTVFAPVVFTAPTNGVRARLVSEATFDGGTTQRDTFGLDLIPAASAKTPPALRLYDPKGQTADELSCLGIAFARIGAQDAVARADEAEYVYESGASVMTSSGAQASPLVIGRSALTRRIFEELLLPTVRAGGRVLVFEQDRLALESLGFRVQEYGLRQAFPRFRDPMTDPVLTTERLHDWAGEATLLPARLKGLDEAELSFPRQMCNGFFNSRVWRCGNRGNVASVLIEKPTVGNWRALVDGAFALQYTPLAEWKLDRGAIVFCQLDVTARTVREPAAEEIVRALVARLSAPVARGLSVKALGRDAELALRDSEAGVNPDVMWPGNKLFVISSGAERPADWETRIRKGATALCLGLTAEEVRAWSPVPVKVKNVTGAHYTRIAEPPAELNGLSNADWAWHGAMDFAAFEGEDPHGNAAFRVIPCGKGRLVFWQVPPWKIDDRAKPYLRITRRRAEAMLARLLGNLGVSSQNAGVRYADAPIPEDDPYRYIRW